ncbi:MAG: YgeY family selenium metabolism-linked hydrolase, partial [Anaerolineae bacterium]|nr:YgeY family selenium metabolism-linked hydrolase [Anaerolineae bacterium]
MAPVRVMIDEEGLVAFAQKLVQTPSVSTQEGEVARLLVEEMERAGFAEVTIDRMGNVIGRIGPQEGPKLLYDAHMDTVDVGDPSAWKRDPFAGEIQGGVLYGRGACDMKGALAAMVYAGKAIVEGGFTLGGGLYVVGVVQEEPCEGLAIQHVIEREGLRPNWVVLGEATNLQLSRGQRGRIEFRITVRGRSCHASRPERGVNAIYEAARVIVGLELLAPQLNRDSFLGKGSITVTEINSTSGSRNAVPDSCTLYVDRRLTVGETETKALAELRQVLGREGVRADIEVPLYRAKSYTGYAVEHRQQFPYWVTAEDDPLLLQAVEVIEDTL